MGAFEVSSMAEPVISVLSSYQQIAANCLQMVLLLSATDKWFGFQIFGFISL
jgi:hypothetical protein